MAGVDVNADVVESVNRGKVHIVEPELESFVQKAVASGALKGFTALQPADIYMICVPTPFIEGGDIPTPNIDYVLAAAEAISSLVKTGDIIIVESTSPVGTTDKVRRVINENSANAEEISFAYCPERVLPGNVMSELVNNDRIVGGLDDSATKKVAAFYQTFVKGEVLQCSANVAELCKLAENSYRDVNIAFANELSMICDTHQINVWDLIRLANHHPRVNILQPGTGVGGHCIAVDPWFIVSGDLAHSKLIRQARHVNDAKTDWVLAKIGEKVKEVMEVGIEKPVLACLGLAFKPDIDDLRESPAVNVVTQLMADGLDVVVREPNIEVHEQFRLVSFEDALNADLVILLVKHSEFVRPENRIRLSEIRALDFCGVLY